MSEDVSYSIIVFLSTLSLRRATNGYETTPYRVEDFYPRSPCGERRAEHHANSQQEKFLSTLSLRRATVRRTLATVRALIFLSTLSLRRATERAFEAIPDAMNFYPRSPCGERPQEVTTMATPKNFYPRSPCGERHWDIAHGERQKDISIHALLAESDSKSAQNSGALLRIWNKFYGDCIFMLTGKAVFYPFCPCFFHIFWCEGTGNFMIAFPSH